MERGRRVASAVEAGGVMTSNRLGKEFIMVGILLSALAVSMSVARTDQDQVRYVDSHQADLVAPATPIASGAQPSPPTDDDFYPRDSEKEALGKLLFFDKILSGNGNISCATCHHPLAGTTDWLSLPVGEGGAGLATARNTGSAHERVPRNAPHVFNLGAKEFKRMFHDGRLEVDTTQPSGFLNPAGDQLPPGLDNVLAAQAMFPVTSGAEMAGQPNENEVAIAAANNQLAGPGGVWDLLAQRLRTNEIYAEMFVNAFEDVWTEQDITFVHAANAIAEFEAAAWRFDDSPFDRFLRGDRQSMSVAARRGLKLFYGAARCSSCHSGPFQTDHEFYAVGVPQIGPGKGDNLPGYDDGLDDFGRERVTGDPDDRFRFRVPTLRNVVLSGPWGHDGAFNDLEAMVRHQMDPLVSLMTYDTSQTLLPPDEEMESTDFQCHEDPARRAAVAAAIEIEPVDLTQKQVEELLAFLHALTDPRAFDLRNDVPMTVPSGLPVAD
jgi:cytochrome c peroxidase